MKLHSRIIAALMMTLIPAASAFAQLKVSGTVKDKAGVPVIATPVQIKGTSRGEVTDLEGNYSISASPDDILVVTAIGYKTAEVGVEGRSRVDIILEDDVETLDEVVVVGYTTIKKTFEWCHIPVILLTAKQTSADKIAGYEVGADGERVEAPGKILTGFLRNAAITLCCMARRSGIVVAGGESEGIDGHGNLHSVA